MIPHSITHEAWCSFFLYPVGVHIRMSQEKPKTSTMGKHHQRLAPCREKLHSSQWAVASTQASVNEINRRIPQGLSRTPSRALLQILYPPHSNKHINKNILHQMLLSNPPYPNKKKDRKKERKTSIWISPYDLENCDMRELFPMQLYSQIFTFPSQSSTPFPSPKDLPNWKIH